jgi:hypothetical protein
MALDKSQSAMILRLDCHRSWHANAQNVTASVLFFTRTTSDAFTAVHIPTNANAGATDDQGFLPQDFQLHRA